MNKTDEVLQDCGRVLQGADRVQDGDGVQVGDRVQDGDRELQDGDREMGFEDVDYEGGSGGPVGGIGESHNYSLQDFDSQDFFPLCLV